MTTTRDSMIQAFTYPELPTVTLSPVRGKPRAARGHDSDQLSYRRCLVAVVHCEQFQADIHEWSYCAPSATS